MKSEFLIFLLPLMEVKDTQRAYVEATSSGAMERVRIWREEVAQYREDLAVPVTQHSSNSLRGRVTRVAEEIEISESGAIPRDVSAKRLRLLLDLLESAEQPIFRFLPRNAGTPSAMVCSLSPARECAH